LHSFGVKGGGVRRSVAFWSGDDTTFMILMGYFQKINQMLYR
jgi:hypothetical protein